MVGGIPWHTSLGQDPAEMLVANFDIPLEVGESVRCGRRRRDYQARRVCRRTKDIGKFGSTLGRRYAWHTGFGAHPGM